MCNVSDLGIELQRARHDAGLSRERLAKIAGLDAKTIWRYEYGEASKLEIIDIILRALGHRLRIEIVEDK